MSLMESKMVFVEDDGKCVYLGFLLHKDATPSLTKQGKDWHLEWIDLNGFVIQDKANKYLTNPT